MRPLGDFRARWLSTPGFPRRRIMDVDDDACPHERLHATCAPTNNEGAIQRVRVLAAAM